MATLCQIMRVVSGGDFAVMSQGEPDTGLCKCNATDDFGTMAVLGLFRFEKFSPGRRISVQFVDFHGGSPISGTGFKRIRRVVSTDLPGVGLSCSTRL